MNDKQTYREICDDYQFLSKRSLRRKSAQEFGSRFFYNYRKNKHYPCVIQGSKGLQIEAMINGDKIVWFDTLVNGKYVD